MDQSSTLYLSCLLELNYALVTQICTLFYRKELVWNARLQPTTEYPIEQMETEASHSPTGTVQSLSPTWEMLQVAFSVPMRQWPFHDALSIHTYPRTLMMTQETTARLLFMAVRWVRCLPPFQTISKDDQLLLLERSWTQLFLLHLAQWSISWDITALLEDEQVRSRLPADDNPTNQELVLIQVHVPSISRRILARFSSELRLAWTRCKMDDT